MIVMSSILGTLALEDGDEECMKDISVISSIASAESMTDISVISCLASAESMTDNSVISCIASVESMIDISVISCIASVESILYYAISHGTDVASNSEIFPVQKKFKSSEFLMSVSGFDHIKNASSTSSQGKQRDLSIQQ